MGVITGCARKAEPLAAQDNNPILDIPFITVLDNYFFDGDTSGFAECIGKVIVSDEMKKVSEKYSENGYLMRFNGKYLFAIVFQEPMSTSSSKHIIYTMAGIRRPDGLTDEKILDIKTIEGRDGYILGTSQLYEDDLQDSRDISQVPNYIGVIEYKFSNGLVFDTRIIPKWIVTANEEGGIIITEPIDDERYVYFSSEP
jgi:hypothetical protein